MGRFHSLRSAGMLRGKCRYLVIRTSLHANTMHGMSTVYTVNHKKRDILFLTITLASLNFQLSNLQRFHFNIVILRVAIISNLQNVRPQRRHRPTDNASTRRRRGSQQTGSVRTTR